MSDNTYIAGRWFASRDGNLNDGSGNPLPQQIQFTIAKGGSSNICLVSLQVADAPGVALAQVFRLTWWLSDAATGAGLTATTASGAVGAGASGTDLGVLTAKKATESLTAATGVYQLSITDTAKTGFYVAVECPFTGIIWISPQLVTANYD